LNVRLLMITRIFICIFAAILLIETNVRANPFASKIDPVSDQNGEKSLDKLIYKGYIFSGAERYAIIQLGKKQYTLKKGQSVDKLEIINVSPKSLQFRLGGILLKTGLEKTIKN